MASIAKALYLPYTGPILALYLHGDGGTPPPSTSLGSAVERACGAGPDYFQNQKPQPHFYNPISVKLCSPSALDAAATALGSRPGGQSLPRPLARQGRCAPPPAVPSASLTGSLGLGGPTAWPGRKDAPLGAEPKDAGANLLSASVSS